MTNRLTYVAGDSVVGIDGEFYQVTAEVDTNIRAIQWYGDHGEVEFADGSANKTIESIDQYSILVTAWETGKRKANKPNNYSTWDDASSAWVEDQNLKEEFEKQQQIMQSKQYLSETDFKMLPDYIPRQDGEPIEDIKAKRAVARELIRQLEQ